MDTDAEYKLLRAWMLAHQVDPDAAMMIAEQFRAGRISLNQAVTGLLTVTSQHRGYTDSTNRNMSL